MKTSVTWKGRMSFDGHTDSGFTVPIGTDPSVGGDNDGPRPMELLAMGLAGCTAMDVISILQKKRQQISAFEVRVDADRADEHPKVIASAVIEYVVTGKGVDENAVLRAIELSALRYCPAQAMLVKAFPMELVYTIYEEGQSEPAVRGKYTPGEVA
ncbi:MAG: OsmC family protein [Chloroflexota bacterium]